MIYLAPKGTKIEFNEKGTFPKYPENFTFETAYQKLGLSHRLIESYTPTTHWNSNLAEQGKNTLKTIREGKGKNNLDNIKLEQNEIYLTYSNLIGFPEVFERTYGVPLHTFLDIVNAFILECYPHDNTLGIWKIGELQNNTICKRHKLKDVKQVVAILSNLDGNNTYYGMLVVSGIIFSTFERLTESALFTLDNCFSIMYENNLKGKNFEKPPKKC